jgi:hypothetical protein
MFYMYIYANHGGKWINERHRQYGAIRRMHMISQKPKDLIKTDAVKPTFHISLTFYKNLVF